MNCKFVIGDLVSFDDGDKNGVGIITDTIIKHKDYIVYQVWDGEFYAWWHEVELELLGEAKREK
jgi:hypothetical protein